MHPGIATIGESNNLSSHFDSQPETHLTQIALFVALQFRNKFGGKTLHKLAVVRINGFGRKEASCLFALLVMGWSLLEKNRRFEKARKLLHLRSAKASLFRRITAQNSPGFLKAAHMPDPAGIA